MVGKIDYQFNFNSYLIITKMSCLYVVTTLKSEGNDSRIEKCHGIYSKFSLAQKSLLSTQETIIKFTLRSTINGNSYQADYPLQSCYGGPDHNNPPTQVVLHEIVCNRMFYLYYLSDSSDSFSEPPGFEYTMRKTIFVNK